MVPYYGDFAEDATVSFCWATYDAAGASVTRATDGTIKVRRHDDGTDCTGTSVTDTEDTPDTGLHECKIDTSDNANYTTGNDYTVWLDGAVIDGQTVNAVLATFSIENRFAEVDVVKWLGQACAAVATNGVPKVDLTYILGHLLTQTGTQVADAFEKFFDVATPTGTVNSLPDAVPGAANGVFIAGTNAATSITTALTANITGNITGNLSGSVGSLTGHTVQTGDSYAIVNNGTYGNAQLVRSTTPANALDVSATGEAGLDFSNIKDATDPHNLANITVPTVTTTGTASAVTLVSDNAITATSFHANVGTTAYASNRIAVAANKTIENAHLDHLVALKTTVATADSKTSFTLTAGKATNDAFNGMLIMVEDADDNNFEVRRVEDWTSGLVVTVDRAFSFTPAEADQVFLMGTGYNEEDLPVPGAYQGTVTIRTTGGTAIQGATVWVSTNASGDPAYTNSQVTDNSGQASFWLANGDRYYFFAIGAGYSYATGSYLDIDGAAASDTFDIGTAISGGAGGASDDTFITRMVNAVRLATDEPATNTKYSDANILEFIQEAYISILSEVQRNQNTQIVAEYSFTYDEDIEYYALPGTAGSIQAVGCRDSASGIKWFFRKGSILSEYGTRMTIENNFLKFQPKYIADGTTVIVWYLPSGCAKLFSASTTTFTASSITFDSDSLDEGSRDVRPNAYVGSKLRILPDTNNTVQQERLITSQTGDAYNVFNVSPDFSPALSTTAVFEICPAFPIDLDNVVSLKVALRILMTEGDRDRYRLVQSQYKDALRTVRLAAANKDHMEGAMNRTDGFQGRYGSRMYNSRRPRR